MLRLDDYASLIVVLKNRNFENIQNLQKGS